MRKSIVTSTAEDYLEAIYNLEKNNLPVKTNDISEFTGNSPSTVTEMIQKLANDGFLEYKKYYGVNLTEKGLMVAKNISRRHIFLTEFFQMLGIPDNISEEDACKVEHIINQETFKNLILFVKFIESQGMEEWKAKFECFKSSESII